jgi:hypothetical protein
MNKIEKEVACQFEKRTSEWPKYIGILLTFTSLLIGAFAWATNRYEILDDKIVTSSTQTKTEIKEYTRERYVPIEDFAQIKECLKNSTDKLNKMDLKLDSLLKIDDKGSRRR